MKMPLLSLAFALAFLVPSSAAECVPTTSEADVTLGAFYVDDAISCSSYDLEGCPFRVCLFPIGGPCLVESGLWYMWVYEESNGIPGLQRQDEMQDDTCGGVIPGDRILY